MEIFNQPEISADKTAVVFTIADSNLFNQDMEKTLSGGALWDLTKEYVHPYMARLVVDLQPALLELKELLPLNI